jgi:hypothetical protein
MLEVPPLPKPPYFEPPDSFEVEGRRAFDWSYPNFDPALPEAVSTKGFFSYSPWDVVITSTGGSGYTYRLIPSTVNGVAPNNFTTVFSGNKSSAKYINLSISATNGRITSVVISSGGAPVDAPPVLQSIPPSSFNLQIGVIGTDGIYYKFVAPKPLVASPTVSFEADRTTPIPGLSPRIQWWTWVVTQP